MRHLLSRRAFIVGTAGLAGAAGAGLLAVASTSDADLVDATLRRLVGDHRLSPPDLVAFTRDFTAALSPSDRTRAALVRVVEATGLGAIGLDAGPDRLVDAVERFERNLLTAYVLSTDAVGAGPGSGPVTYAGRLGGCGNPFAGLDPDDLAPG